MPLIMQNIHRYFLYLALLFILVLAWDAWKGMWFVEGTGADAHGVFGLGVGSIVLTMNVILLGGYTLGCHSLRHLVGGRAKTAFQSTPCDRSPGNASAASTGNTCSGPG